ncbi:2OG-Fe(II) oxygenase [Novosphingobium sp. 9]|uniref:2OG-Fe(II) oxygenase n=1 Tax=Novosphingobium sp. 9 TaxID=2025349 RepID=UPI0021B6C2DA|nr:2OG-Fe(II) oxygenase family protein [Novosphingobium sp. 9]
MLADPFTLNPALNPEHLGEVYRQRCRVRIAGFLGNDGPQRLLTDLDARTDWRQVFNSGSKLYELDRPARESMTQDQREALDGAIHAQAREGFQYRYETVRVPDGKAARAASTDILARFADWLSSEAALSFLRQITGHEDIRFADTQATAYAPGDFLTAHTDNVAGKDRRAAFVLSLNAGWRAEWGGLLMFHGENGSFEGVAPAFNTLDLLAVPQSHSVSYVAPSAARRRLSITGWLRAQEQPA